MADGFRDATPVAVSGSVSTPEMKMVVEAAVAESESVDGDFLPPVGVTKADHRLHFKGQDTERHELFANLYQHLLESASQLVLLI